MRASVSLEFCLVVLASLFMLAAAVDSVALLKDSFLPANERFRLARDVRRLDSLAKLLTPGSELATTFHSPGCGCRQNGNMLTFACSGNDVSVSTSSLISFNPAVLARKGDSEVLLRKFEGNVVMVDAL